MRPTLPPSRTSTLHERVWRAANAPAFTERLFGPSDPSWAGAWCWAAYSEANGVLHSIFRRRTWTAEPFPTDYLPLGEHSTFERFVTQYNPRTLAAATFALDYYILSASSDGVTPPGQRFRPDPLADAVTRHTHGLLLWRWQYERLIEPFVASPVEAQHLARLLVMRLADAWVTVKKMKLASRLSVADVLVDRTLLGGTLRNASLGAARHLLAHLGVLNPQLPDDL